MGENRVTKKNHPFGENQITPSSFHLTLGIISMNLAVFVSWSIWVRVLGLARESAPDEKPQVDVVIWPLV